MFKALKYVFIASLYKKTKKSFLMLFIYVILINLFSSIVSDLLNVASGSYIYIVLALKWIGIPVLVLLISLHILKIYNAATTNPFNTKEQETAHKDEKKEKILYKETLNTQSDLILQKYMKES